MSINIYYPSLIIAVLIAGIIWTLISAYKKKKRREDRLAEIAEKLREHEQHKSEQN